ncbi:MAG: phospholipid transport system substrate-binding protein [Cycloclasticus sp.]|jgi:phospholipid transport system substrate-binding protein|tara:strand:+ start:123951 stop:124613 length:663 start_codon:yes stop_codon:yes gene_type:complete
MNKINGFFLTGLFFVLSAVHVTVAADELNEPQKVIQETSNLLYNIVKNDQAKLNDRAYIFKLVDEVIEPRVDLDKISKLVLGKYWRTATEKQKSDFQKEFKGLLVNTYATAFTEFEEWTVHFLPMSMAADDNRVIVKTEIIQPSRPPVAVDYRMALNKSGDWKAYDVIIEGISMVTNYKGSFATSIKNSGGLDNVIKALIEKNEQSKTSSLALTAPTTSS